MCPKWGAKKLEKKKKIIDEQANSNSQFEKKSFNGKIFHKVPHQAKG